MPHACNPKGRGGTKGTRYSPFRYTGSYLDAGTPFYQMGARYYHPSAGRFTQQDPLGSSVLKPNRYAYAGCNPANRVDPTGLWYCDLGISGGYIIGATLGLQFNTEEAFWYAGGGLVTPGATAYFTCSPMNPSTGLSAALAGAYIAAAEIGISGTGPFVELGLGWFPGVSLMVTNTWEL
jgi:RHS repeat-associated protein